MGKTYSKRPSDLLGLKTEWGRHQFDELCTMVGVLVEGNLSQNKPAFEGLEESTSTSNKTSYAPVPKRGMRRVKINPNGTW